MTSNAAYVGLAGPIGYDYANPAPLVDERDGSSPNPVLENVLGLLLCYDEIVFLAPQFCPADMRELPYVRFLSDDATSLNALSSALAAFDETDHDRWSITPSFDKLEEISAVMRGSSTDWAMDNHTHAVHIGDRRAIGNAMALDNAVRDLWVAAELELSHTDVIFSSPAQEALNSELERELTDNQYFDSTKRAAATQLVALQVPNLFGPSGSYHEGLESIRDRRDVAEFRQYLMSVDANPSDGAKLANEISSAAFTAVDDLSHRYLKNSHVFSSVGVPAVRGVLNSVAPGLGTAAAFGLEAPFKIGERRFKKSSQWAPFVVSLHRPVAN